MLSKNRELLRLKRAIHIGFMSVLVLSCNGREGKRPSSFRKKVPKTKKNEEKKQEITEEKNCKNSFNIKVLRDGRTVVSKLKNRFETTLLWDFDNGYLKKYLPFLNSDNIISPDQKSYINKLPNNIFQIVKVLYGDITYNHKIRIKTNLKKMFVTFSKDSNKILFAYASKKSLFVNELAIFNIRTRMMSKEKFETPIEFAEFNTLDSTLIISHQSGKYIAHKINTNGFLKKTYPLNLLLTEKVAIVGHSNDTLIVENKDVLMGYNIKSGQQSYKIKKAKMISLDETNTYMLIKYSDFLLDRILVETGESLGQLKLPVDVKISSCKFEMGTINFICSGQSAESRIYKWNENEKREEFKCYDEGS